MRLVVCLAEMLKDKKLRQDVLSKKYLLANRFFNANLNRYYDSVKFLKQFPSEVVIPGHGDLVG